MPASVIVESTTSTAAFACFVLDCTARAAETAAAYDWMTFFEVMIAKISGSSWSTR